MQIFLGKNWLGQSDKQDVQLSSMEINPEYNLNNLSEEELLKFRELVAKVRKNGQSSDSGRD